MGLEQLGSEDYFLVPPSDPVVIELNRLHNQLKEKDRELGVAQGEIKALRVTEVLKDKAVEELNNELRKLDEKLRTNENLLDHKNLELKKLTNEKKEALAAQFAAEATLRRVHANQRDEDSFPIEAVIAPLEAEIKMYKNEIVALREDKKFLERLTKSKEFALLEAERILKSALERALIVEEVQNQNMELKRQIEICQEENRILDKTNRQKVSEIEKLSQTIRELEESILACGAIANAVHDSQRQISELNEEKKMLERELARAKISASRVATMVANEWKDDNDKVMPVKQWLEERRFLQAEIQRLKDKLAISERTAKVESQLKDKLKLRLKTLEEGLKHVSSYSNGLTASSEPQQNEKPNHVLGFLNNAGVKKRSSSQPRGSVCTNKNSPLRRPNVRIETTNADGQLKGVSSSSSQTRGPVCANKSSPLRRPNVGIETDGSDGQLKGVNSFKMKYGGGESMLRKSLWGSRNKIQDNAGKENAEVKANSDVDASAYIASDVSVMQETRDKNCPDVNFQNKGIVDANSEDVVSGFLYDRLQREVINLRKRCEEKEGTLNAKEEEIKMLMRKVDAINKAMEIEYKKLRREAAAREKEVVLAKVEDNKYNIKCPNFSKRTAKAS